MNPWRFRVKRWLTGAMAARCLGLSAAMYHCQELENETLSGVYDPQLPVRWQDMNFHSIQPCPSTTPARRSNQQHRRHLDLPVTRIGKCCPNSCQLHVDRDSRSHSRVGPNIRDPVLPTFAALKVCAGEHPCERENRRGSGCLGRPAFHTVTTRPVPDKRSTSCWDGTRPRIFGCHP